MMEHIKELQSLLEYYPVQFGELSISQLEEIFRKYEAILLDSENISEGIKRNTHGHQLELGDLKFKLKQARKAKSAKERQSNFKDARNNLKDDIETLISIIER